MESKARLVSEPVEPAPGTFDPRGMAAGGPGLPARFTWRGVEYAVIDELGTDRSTGPCRHGSGERYVRRHYFKVRVEPAATMTLYFERTGTKARPGAPRWFLYTVET